MRKAGKRASKAEWLLQKEERIEQWISKMASQHTMPLSYPIWDAWRYSSDDTWPESLRCFWHHAGSQWSPPDKAQTIVRELRAHYASDAELSAIADWIESGL
jgi:hypothetical protein